ncbi:MAG: DinB family protein [Actinomycetota bacterium]|nr:DinB family protein [Actinomycetota bacterium]
MSESRCAHDSFVDALVVCIDRALDGMLETVRQLGDGLVNARTGLRAGNTAFQLVWHCCGVLEFWGGRVLADRAIERDREAEFRASGAVVELEERVAAQRAKFTQDLTSLDGAAGPRGPLRERDLDREEFRTQAGILLHIYEELAQHRGHLDLTADIVTAQ